MCMIWIQYILQKQDACNKTSAYLNYNIYETTHNDHINC